MSQLAGLQGHIPAALLFIQTIEQQVHLMVQFLVCMIVKLLKPETDVFAMHHAVEDGIECTTYLPKDERF